MRLRGLGYRLKRDYPAAIVAYREAIEIYRRTSSETTDLAIALNSLAVAERLSGDLSSAERDYGEALRIALAIGQAEMIAGIPGDLAELAMVREDWPTGERLAREALPCPKMSTAGVGCLQLPAPR